MSASMNYLDGNAAAGELSRIFAFEITAAQGRCADCGATRHFAEAHVYMNCPGIVARCPICGHILLRLVNAGKRLFVDMSGTTCFVIDTSDFQESSG